MVDQMNGPSSQPWCGVSAVVGVWCGLVQAAEGRVRLAGVWQNSGLVQAGSGSSSSRVSVLGWNSCHLKT